MRTRPLALLCLAVAIFLALNGCVQGKKRDAALLEVQEYLTGIAGTNNTLTIEGIVKEVTAVSEGTRLSISQIRIISDSSTDTALSSESLSELLSDSLSDSSSDLLSDLLSDLSSESSSDLSSGSANSQKNVSVSASSEAPAETTAKLSSEIKLLVTVETDDYLPGDCVRVTGRYRPLEEAGNPGQFDSQEYYFAKNTVGRMTSASVSRIAEGAQGLSRMLARVRRELRYSYLRILDEEAARTISAISLGEKSYMEQEWKQLYQEGGISHILSISGLHISLIGMCIYSLLRRARLPFVIAAVPSAAIVALYALMSGFGVSAMRACIMFILWLGAQIAGRKDDTLTSTALAAALILAGDGRAATGSSFLLSFGAILSIALLVPRLAAANPFRERSDSKAPESHLQDSVRRQKGGKETISGIHQSQSSYPRIRKPAIVLWKRLRPLLWRLWNALCGGAGVWLGTLPITLSFFYQCAPWSLLVNLAVIPLMSALMASGLISCLIGLISVPAGTFFSAPVYYLLAIFRGFCTIEQQLPGAVWIAGCPALWKIIGYYTILTGTALLATRFSRSDIRKHPGQSHVPGKSPAEKKPVKAQSEHCFKTVAPACLWIAFFAIGLSLMAYHPRTGLTVISLDVGQGDGALIQLPDGTNCLIDGGSTSVSSLWQYRISQTLKYYGIRRLDYVFLSHADSDHINGIQEYLDDYLPGFAGTNAHGISLQHLVLPPTADESDFEELIESAKRLGIPILRMAAGAQVGKNTSASGEAAWSLTCLAPSSNALSGDANEDSMVLLLQYGSFRMLFTGDLEGDQEKALALSDEDLSCDVLKVGHHGSKGASSEEFLTAAAPSFGIISCGKNNNYGHPASVTVERLHAAGITLYATMDCGAITIRSDGIGYQICGYIKTEAYP